MIDLIVRASEPVNITLGAIKEEDVRALMVQPWNIIASDGAYAEGVVHMVVNGVPVMRDGELTGRAACTFLTLSR